MVGATYSAEFLTIRESRRSQWRPSVSKIFLKLLLAIAIDGVLRPSAIRIRVRRRLLRRPHPRKERRDLGFQILGARGQPRGPGRDVADRIGAHGGGLLDRFDLRRRLPGMGGGAMKAFGDAAGR